MIDFLAASITMIGTLCFGVIPYAYAAYHPNPVNTITVVCKIRAYAAQCFTMIYRWLMAMACIDRYMLSSKSIRLRVFANPRIAYRIVLINVIIWFVLPVHNLIFLEVRAGNICGFPLVAAIIYHSIFTTLLGGILPPLIMIICAVLIHYNLASKQARRRRTIHPQVNQQPVDSLNARDYQALIMLFVQVFFYILSTTPWTICLLYTASTRQITNKSMNRLLIESFMQYLAEIIAYVYPTISFYIYTLTSKGFRHQLIKAIYSIFTCVNGFCPRPRRIRPNVETT